jgi:hypothetical protein
MTISTLVQVPTRRTAQRQANRLGSVNRYNPTARPMPFSLAKPPAPVQRLDAEGRAVTPSPPPVHFATDPNSIVTVQVSTIIAPTPNNYQQTGALVSFGATQLAANEVYQLSQYSDLTLVNSGAGAITSVAWAAGEITVTATDPLPPGWTIGSTPQVVISGFTPAGYNGTFPAQVTGANSFTYPMTPDPGTETVMGTFQPQAAVELSQMAATFFAQGNMISVYVLELGAQATDQAKATALFDWAFSTNPRSFYGYVLPRECGATQVALQIWQTTVFNHFQSPESMTYFWLTVTPTTMSVLQPQPTIDAPYKDVIQMVEAPSVTDPTMDNISNPAGEFTIASMFYNAMAFSPSQVNMIAPLAFRYLYGVTAYPTQNNGTLLLQINAANTNYVATGAQGGIAYNDAYKGVTLDNQDYFNWWYTIDWVQIAAQQGVANAIINGSNNPLAPLYYNQDGIITLQAALFNVMYAAQTFGMVVGTIQLTGYNQPTLSNAIAAGNFAGICDINAVSFLDYTLAKPGDYKIGEYDGLSVLFIPARGFIHVLVTIVASDLVTV